VSNLQYPIIKMLQVCHNTLVNNKLQFYQWLAPWQTLY